MSRLENIADQLQCPVSFLFRSEDATIQEQAATIADILATVPVQGQEAIVNLVAETARVMNYLRK